MACVYRASGILPIDGLSPYAAFSPVRKSVPKRSLYEIFLCLDQFLCMSFARLSFRESLRDIGSRLRAMQNKLDHMGIRTKVARSTLTDANQNRDWRIAVYLAQSKTQSTSLSLQKNQLHCRGRPLNPRHARGRRPPACRHPFTDRRDRIVSQENRSVHIKVTLALRKQLLTNKAPPHHHYIPDPKVPNFIRNLIQRE